MGLGRPSLAPAPPAPRPDPLAPAAPPAASGTSGPRLSAAASSSSSIARSSATISTCFFDLRASRARPLPRGRRAVPPPQPGQTPKSKGTKDTLLLCNHVLCTVRRGGVDLVAVVVVPVFVMPYNTAVACSTATSARNTRYLAE
ncbi:hypothetical protein TSOC_005217 [Tetrabaena socialis]|uniref:Uncharacterized protein n=1 Tax=Tetrabaena socialis TaxID=47790 RepID=A0A2J8A6V4_9CHLO|nr:hypothetical protein TSOC_005217 [Tetrabaena socialis]|eukprot:PNH08237.1 hypothetical protein TSOC_005217 [Tetrabaena socialis]